MTNAVFRRAGMVSALIVLAAGPAMARQGAWREVFQSSPASYAPVPPEVLQAAAAQFKLPMKVIEAGALPRPATGTLRFRFAVSAGGSKVRIRVSNEDGAAPLTISAASLGLAAQGADAASGPLRALTFGGRASVTIPAGAALVSDPVDLATTPGTDLLASLFTPDTLSLDPRGAGLLSVAAGNQTMATVLADAKPMAGRPLVTGAEVFSDDPARVIVTFGDSITDGNRTDPAVLHGWPAELAQRLRARAGGARFAVANAGIGGNRLLAGGSGDAAVARFDRDVLNVAGVSHVVILEGINDIGMSGRSAFGDNPPVSAQDIIGAYRRMIAKAHARGVKVALATILPFGKAPLYFTPAKEAVRQAVNTWIRTSHAADAVIDFDAVARDPASPVDMRRDFGSIDGLHPGPAGYRTLGDAIDLSIFR